MTVLPFTRRPAPLRGPSAASLRAAVRLVVAKEIERLLDLLDALDGDPDAEPSLGWPEGIGSTEPPGGTDDREDDAGDDREPDEDREPILGWTGDVDQAGSDRFGEARQHDEAEESEQPLGMRPHLPWRSPPASPVPRAPVGEA